MIPQVSDGLGGRHRLRQVGARKLPSFCIRDFVNELVRQISAKAIDEVRTIKTEAKVQATRLAKNIHKENVTNNIPEIDRIEFRPCGVRTTITSALPVLIQPTEFSRMNFHNDIQTLRNANGVSSMVEASG